MIPRYENLLSIDTWRSSPRRSRYRHQVRDLELGRMRVGFEWSLDNVRRLRPWLSIDDRGEISLGLSWGDQHLDPVWGVHVEIRARRR